MAIESLFGELPEKWETATLGEICQRGGGFIQTGPFGSQLHAADYVDQGIPSIMPQNIGDNQVIEDDISRIKEQDAERLSKYRVQTDDIVYSRRGDVTRRALIREEHNGWLCGTGSLMIRLGKGIVDPRFVSYFLGDPSIREWIQRHAVGATMPNLNTSIMGAVPFINPPIPEQCAIAGILGALDDKIELNRRTNSTLNDLASTIFKEWFISDTDFELGEIGNIVSEISNRNSTNEIIPVFSAVKTGELLPSDEVFTKQVYSRDLSKYKIIQRNNYAYNPARVNIGSIGMLEEEQGLVSPVYIAFSVKEGCEWLLFFFLRLPQTRAIIKQLCSGSVRQNLSFKDFASIEIPMPSENELQEFNKIWLDIRNMILHNEKESHTLASLRDTLLPKLMRGEVRMKAKV